ncbi:MAG: PfkB family carbohydrate kinase [Micropruina sp.]
MLWWGKDERGDRLAEWATSSGVSIVLGTDSAAKTAVASPGWTTRAGPPTSSTGMERAGDRRPVGLRPPAHRQHRGQPGPGGTAVVENIRAIRDRATISYDPNIRPALMVSPEAVVGRVEDIVSLSDLVKVSDEDLEWLYPGEPVEDIMRRWIKAGPSMVVVTRGPWGAYALLADNRDMLHIDQMNVTVGDTVGAGDSFMAGLIAGLLKSGLLGSVEARQRLADAGWSDVQSALHNAVVTSGITVSKHGAYAPTADEVEAVKQADPSLY